MRRFVALLLLLSAFVSEPSARAQVVSGSFGGSSGSVFGNIDAENAARRFKEKDLTASQIAEVERLYSEAASASRAGRVDLAIDRYSRIANINPRAFDALASRGTLWLMQKEWAKAKADFLAAAELYPDAPRAAENVNNLAWLLATCPDDSIRDGKRAVELAEKAYAASPGIATADTLAAAYAEVGDFTKAIETQNKVIVLARRFGDPEEPHLVRLAEYEAGQPHRLK